jgi:glucose-1-phosphatase
MWQGITSEARSNIMRKHKDRYMPITTILFDLGRTLLDFDFDPINQRLMASSGLAEDAVKVLTLQQYELFSAGKMTGAEWQHFIEDRFQLTMSSDEFRRFWADIFTPIDAMFDLAHRTHRHHRHYLLSNTDEIHISWCLERYTKLFAGLLDGMILSYEAAAIKPDPRIFEYGMERFELVAEECVFIDDLPANIDAAREFGMHGVVIVTPDQVERDLVALGVDVS